MFRSDDIGVQSFDFFKKVEKWVLRAIIFLTDLKKESIFFMNRIKKGYRKLNFKTIAAFIRSYYPPKVIS
jgi:hypothetical protein